MTINNTVQFASVIYNISYLTYLLSCTSFGLLVKKVDKTFKEVFHKTVLWFLKKRKRNQDTENREMQTPSLSKLPQRANIVCVLSIFLRK